MLWTYRLGFKLLRKSNFGVTYLFLLLYTSHKYERHRLYDPQWWINLNPPPPQMGVITSTFNPWGIHLLTILLSLVDNFFTWCSPIYSETAYTAILLVNILFAIESVKCIIFLCFQNVLVVPGAYIVGNNLILSCNDIMLPNILTTRNLEKKFSFRLKVSFLKTSRRTLYKHQQIFTFKLIAAYDIWDFLQILMTSFSVGNKQKFFWYVSTYNKVKFSQFNTLYVVTTILLFVYFGVLEILLQSWANFMCIMNSCNYSRLK